jgi:hypothetical protein
MEELPGPPFSQIVRGAFFGSLRASKNQKNSTKVSKRRSSQLLDAQYTVDGVVLTLSQVCRPRRKINVSSIGLYAGSGFAERVLLGSSVFST